MRERKMRERLLCALCACALALSGCGGKGQNQSQTPPASQANAADATEAASQANVGDTGEADSQAWENQTPGNFDDLLEAAAVCGSVAQFGSGSFQVTPEQDEGDSKIVAAPGYETMDEASLKTVVYDGSCSFQTAYISTADGSVTYEDASGADVKKSTPVAVIGTLQENGDIKASLVVITRYQ